MNGFDWKKPDYVTVLRERADALNRIRQNPAQLPALKAYYKTHIAEFISDWGCTVDPRNVERDLPAEVPFVLFPRQVEWVDWLIKHWRSRTPGLTEKSREMGVSWLAIAASCSLCLFYDGMAIGFGSRKSEYVDHLNAPKALFPKARSFMRALPPEFQGGWDEDCAPYMRIIFPETASHISGEGGDNIGRGDRTSIYMVDEAAYLEHPTLVEASLSQTTNCRIDIGTPNGNGNPFAQKRFGGKIDVFTFHWKDDPRKDDAWYAKQLEELDPVVVAQEVDIDYSASTEGIIIPASWARAAIDAHLKLGVAVSGACTGALDIADEGRDKCAYAGGQGILIDCLEEWSGKGSDTFFTAERAFQIADTELHEAFKYDADGLGAFVRGDARVINERRKAQGQRTVRVLQYRGSGAVVDPEDQDVKGRLNKDYFMNLKAQSFWRLRKRFQNTYRAVVEGQSYEPCEIISISSKLPLHLKLISELSQPTYTLNSVGKVVVDKLGEGVASPNLADAVVMKFAQSEALPLLINAGALERAKHLAGQRAVLQRRRL
jgi:phage terminase large subunit